MPYELQLSDDGNQWQTLHTGRLQYNSQTQSIQLDVPYSARFVHFRVLEVYGETCVSVTEIEVVNE